MAQAVVLIIASVAADHLPAVADNDLSIIAFLAAAVAVGAWLIVKIPGCPLDALSWQFRCFSGLDAVGQLFSVALVLSLLLRHPAGSDLEIVLSILTALLAIGVLQVAAALAANRVRTHPRPLAAASALGLTAVFVFALIPPMGAALADFALRAPLTGGAACVQITWVPDRAPESVDRRLRVVAPAGDTLLVQRPGVPDTTYFVRRDAILAMTGINCRFAEQRATDERAKAAHAPADALTSASEAADGITR
ncbi:hypothetical protein [Luteimonas sp. TWI1437]|uniref:hypothetical protein n=1 Tax=unclassified Luteimonas TaxID=2629088 RepID=UPI00320AE664